MRALAVVNCQSTPTCRAFRSSSDAATTCLSRTAEPIRRSSHWADRAVRAATWADWVRRLHPFDRPTRRYVNYPIVPAGSAVDPARHEPPAKQENIVNQLAVCVDKIKTGTDEEKAVHLTWLFHLVGDTHQPLHCTAVFSERFPEGDRGGNLAMIRIRSSLVNLHSSWDGLLGRVLTAGDIGKDVREIERVLKDKGAEVEKELAAHQSFESWAYPSYLPSPYSNVPTWSPFAGEVPYYPGGIASTRPFVGGP